ncbi:hypothetical protein OIU83_04575 [Flavobacterium sp. LS1R49]|uniref:Uncharacterized protein n=1 Tax=Flavobacterium shii TaxID=2987687 RepID=A0A9X2ZCP4_9FLAO|nr:hypothetical protein [Flavobacterium shii]MCV9926910.1 hypothetical protein [Flavobacterium shii]
MKIDIIILALLLNVSNCVGQIKEKHSSTIKKDTIIETFDINKYKDWNIDTKYTYKDNDRFYKNGDDRVRITMNGKTIQVEESNIKNPNKITKVFYVKEKTLQSILQEFYTIQIGNYKLYNEIGVLAKDENLDKEYKFSIDDLVKKMKEKYNYDLMNVDKTYNLNRYVDLEKIKLPLYEVYYRDDKNTQVLHSYVINGNTGEILFSTLRSTQGKQGSLYDAFIKVERSKIK